MRGLHGSLHVYVFMSTKPATGLKTTSADFKHFRISLLKVTNTRKSEDRVSQEHNKVLHRKIKVLPRTTWEPLQRNDVGTCGGDKSQINNVLLAFSSKI